MTSIKNDKNENGTLGNNDNTKKVEHPKPVTGMAAYKRQQRHRLVMVAGGILALVVAFGAGMAYDRASRPVANGPGMAGNGQFGERGGTGRMGQRPVVGVITAVNGSTLTINSSGTSKTVNVSNSTTYVGDGGNTPKVGDSIAVFGTANGDTVTATRISLNPSFGGRGAGNDSPIPSGGGTAVQ